MKRLRQQQSEGRKRREAAEKAAQESAEVAPLRQTNTAVVRQYAHVQSRVSQSFASPSPASSVVSQQLHYVLQAGQASFSFANSISRKRILCSCAWQGGASQTNRGTTSAASRPSSSASTSTTAAATRNYAFGRSLPAESPAGSRPTSSAKARPASGSRPATGASMASSSGSSSRPASSSSNFTDSMRSASASHR